MSFAVLLSAGRAAAHEFAPSSWRTQGIGRPPPEATYEVAPGGCIGVRSGSAALTGSGDEGAFFYKELRGAVDLVALADLGSVPDGALAGVMFRSSLDPESPYVSMRLRRTGDAGVFEAAWRDAAGAAPEVVSVDPSQAAATFPPGAYLAVERSGADLVAFSSTDARTWLEVARPAVNLPQVVYAGLIVEAAGEESEALFCDIDAHGGDVTNRAPTASFGPVPEVGPAPLEVRFDATASEDADGAVVSYAWDFGDGETHLFIGGKPLPEPGGAGPDPTPDDVDCGSFSFCP